MKRSKRERKYPEFPMVGVGVLIRKGGKVLLIKRAQPPSYGKWTVPGGLVELGETTRDAAIREMKEECNIQVKIERLLDTFDYIEKDDADKVLYHYIIVDFLGSYVSGELEPGDDVADAAWFTLAEVDRAEIPAKTREIVRKVLHG